MANSFTHTLKPAIHIAVTAGILAILAVACAQKVNFNTSTVVPAAEGKVKIDKDRNNNYKIEVSVMRLAEPEKLEPPKNTYVVWITTSDHGIKNIGRLKTSTGFLSKTLKASLETVTSYKPRRVFVTAENNGAIQYPGNQVVLTTNYLK